MNVLTGIYRPTAGSVTFDGENIAGRAPSRIALNGIARTFQNVQLFGEMTCVERSPFRQGKNRKNRKKSTAKERLHGHLW